MFKQIRRVAGFNIVFLTDSGASARLDITDKIEGSALYVRGIEKETNEKC